MHPFESLFIPDKSVGIWWFGQSSFALKDTAGTILHIDPDFPHARPPEKYVHPVPPLDEATLQTDYVLLTHNHSDHTCIESLQRIHAAHPRARFTGPVESVGNLEAHAIPPSLLASIGAGTSAQLGSMTVHAVWAKPPAGDPRASIPPPDVQHFGYVIQASGVTVYISGDLLHTFVDHRDLIDPIAALKPDIGLLTTHPSEGEFPFYQGSIRMAIALGLKAAVPAHYDCFVSRNYDPHQWAQQFPLDSVQPIVISYNSYIVFPELPAGGQATVCCTT